MLITTRMSKLALFPICNHELWDHYLKQRNSFWTPEEIDLSRDRADWHNLTENEQHFIKHILAFFAVSDGLVNQNLTENFTKEFNDLEVQINYRFQAMIEDVHNHMYSLLIETLIDDEDEKRVLFDGIQHYPTIRTKGEWMKKHMNADIPLVNRLIAFAIVEGVFFSGSFCSIYWLKSRNIMPGLTSSNEFIARDEGMHTDFACLVLRTIFGDDANKPSQEQVVEMFVEAVNIETAFINDALPCKLIGMNSDMMTQYIQHVADRLLEDLGYVPHYNSANPFSFMNFLNLSSKTNFFEKRSTEYSKPTNKQSAIDYRDFNNDDDF